MTASHNPLPQPAHFFQFRIATLFAWTTWAGFICFGMHLPTALMADIIIHVSLLLGLGTILTACYRLGSIRASALGFAILFFGTFYFGPLNPNFSMLSSGDAALEWLFHVVHPDDEVPLRFGGSWIAPPPFQTQDFERICQCALATMLGLLGSLLAQFLHATQPVPPHVRTTVSVG